MKKITLASFVLMGMLVTGLSAIVIGSGNVTAGTSQSDDNGKKNSEKAKESSGDAKDALKELEEATTDSKKCKAFAKVKRLCAMTNTYDDDSSDKGDDASDDASKDNVSDYKHDVDEIWAKAQKMVTASTCKKEIECEELKHKFFYNVHGDDKSENLAMMSHCGDDDGESSDDDKKEMEH